MDEMKCKGGSLEGADLRWCLFCYLLRGMLNSITALHSIVKLTNFYDFELKVGG